MTGPGYKEYTIDERGSTIDDRGTKNIPLMEGVQPLMTGIKGV